MSFLDFIHFILVVSFVSEMLFISLYHNLFNFCRIACDVLSSTSEFCKFAHPVSRKHLPCTRGVYSLQCHYIHYVRLWVLLQKYLQYEAVYKMMHMWGSKCYVLWERRGKALPAFVMRVDFTELIECVSLSSRDALQMKHAHKALSNVKIFSLHLPNSCYPNISYYTLYLTPSCPSSTFGTKVFQVL